MTYSYTLTQNAPLFKSAFDIDESSSILRITKKRNYSKFQTFTELYSIEKR